MIKTLLAASTLVLAALPAAALAQDDQAQTAPSQFYGALGYTQVDTRQADLGAVTVRAGWKVWSHVGVEGEASVGVQDDSFDVSVGGNGGGIELKHDLAAYAVAFLPVGRHIELHARAGFGSASVESSVPAVYAYGAGESFNYGLGMSAFSRSNGLRLDWVRKNFSDSDLEADLWAISYVRRF